MLGGELSFHLLNVLLLTLGIAPLVLWRYRRAVLAGMQGRIGAPLAVAAPSGRPAPTAAGDAPAALRWESRLRRRVFVALLACTFVCALPWALLYFHLAGEPATPVHLYLNAGARASAAVPMAAVMMAWPFGRALGLWLLTLLGLAALAVPLSMLQRPFYGKAPSLDQAMNFVFFLQFAAVTSALRKVQKPPVFTKTPKPKNTKTPYIPFSFTNFPPAHL